MRPSSSEPPLDPARNNATPNRAPSSITTTAVLSLDSRSIVSHDSRRETKGLGPMKKGAGRLLSKHRHITHNLGSECKRLWVLKKSSFLPNGQNFGDRECLEN